MEFALFILLLLLVVPLLGKYMAWIFQKENSLPLLDFLEKGIYRLSGIDSNQEMDWRTYAKALLILNAMGFVFLFFLQIFQGWLPFNPEGIPGVKPALAFNIAASFVTNTNWQAYGGENTLSYLTQMLGMTVQNFMSAATGNAVLLALIRGIHSKSSKTIGNFWRDFTRTIIYLLLPLSLLFSLFLVGQGVVQTLEPYIHAKTIEGSEQIIPVGPAASQIAIKQLGTNGGGFFNANSAHPFENPTFSSNFLGNLAILLIPAAAVYMYGLMLHKKREGMVIFCVMLALWIGGIAVAFYSESYINPLMPVNPVLEGKETRFGIGKSLFWAISTTATSNGSTNSALGSFSPLAGGIALFNIMIGEVVFGGIGVGLCSMLMFVFLTVFLSGLMVGRTPEYMTKKIEKKEMQWAMLALLTPCALILIGSSIASLLPELHVSENAGPHNLSEVLYTFSSASGNNGSAFGGLKVNTTFYNLLLGVFMIGARLTLLTASLGIAGSLAEKKTAASSVGTFSTNTPLFGALLISVILIVAALSFFPALSLGPIVEHLLMMRGVSF